MYDKHESCVSYVGIVRRTERDDTLRRMYMCIDLRSYYASVECVARGLDPMTTRLVVADASRGRGTICLAVSPAMKAAGVPNRCRLFDIPEGMDCIIATPHMRRYMEVSAEVYRLYLRHFSAADIHPYSVDECFVDATSYVGTPLTMKSARTLGRSLMNEIRKQTGIPSTCGIGENLFLAKIALDIEAKHSADGIALLDRDSFLERIWHHRPITDVWGIGRRRAGRLAKYGVHDLCDLAHLDVQLARHEFGVDAELMLDHAWGIEPCTIAEIKSYVPQASSVSIGQVLARDYTPAEARIVIQEMAHEAALELVDRNASCRSVSIRIGCARERERGKVRSQHFGKSVHLDAHSEHPSKLYEQICALFDEVCAVSGGLSIRRMSVALGDLLPCGIHPSSLFVQPGDVRDGKRLYDAVCGARHRFGDDAVMWGTSLDACATGFERARQIGGHRA